MFDLPTVCGFILAFAAVVGILTCSLAHILFVFRRSRGTHIFAVAAGALLGALSGWATCMTTSLFFLASIPAGAAIGTALVLAFTRD